jgi:hypothetical protein
MNLKQIFCSHVWEDIETTLLTTYTVSRAFGFYRPQKLKIMDVSVYAVKQKCVICNKIRTIQVEERSTE